MGARTSVLPDLLSQASPATPPRHDRSTSEEVRINLLCFKLYFFFTILKKRENFIGLVTIIFNLYRILSVTVIELL